MTQSSPWKYSVRVVSVLRNTMIRNASRTRLNPYIRNKRYIYSVCVFGQGVLTSNSPDFKLIQENVCPDERQTHPTWNSYEKTYVRTNVKLTPLEIHTRKRMSGRTSNSPDLKFIRENVCPDERRTHPTWNEYEKTYVRTNVELTRLQIHTRKRMSGRTSN